ncbi:MAG: hypothetical protein ACRC3Y_06740, partial [Romboutsia sp.]|uniref:hypothetical protein n=1 Tax=Romboutsia sp. TaxID=1965302 RepID=UPI003F3A7ED1
MNSAIDYMDISLDIDKKYLHLNQEVVLKIDIKNKSSYVIENSLFRLNINEDILNILDDKFKACITDFISLGDISPGFKLSLQIPLKVSKLPQDFLESIFCYINFHIIKDSELMDFTYKSNYLDIKFMSKIEHEDFSVQFSKEKYFIDEEIHLLLSIRNSAKYILENINICDFMFDGGVILKDKIIYSTNNILDINNTSITIKELGIGDILNIDIPIIVKDDIEIDIAKINPILSYTDKNLKKVEIKKDEISVDINCNDIFDDNSFIYEIDKTSGFLDDVITHKIVIKNNTKLELMDLILQNNFSDKIIFVENSLVVGDIYRVSENISDEIKLGNLDIDENLIITFKTKVSHTTSLDNMKFLLKSKINKRIINQESNAINFKTLYPEFNEVSFKKYQSKDILKLNDIVEITIEACNIGISDAVDVIIKDTLQSGLELINTSLCLNDEIVDSNIANEGIKLKNIAPNETIKITYKAKAIDVCTNEKTNACIIYASQSNYKSIKTYSKETTMTIIGARIGNNNMSIELSDYTAQIEDIVTYKITIQNTGNIDCEDLKFEAPINDAIEFVDESLRIDDREYKELNIFDGIRLSRIKPNQIIKISYQVKIIDFPRPNPISDRPQLEYSYLFEDKLQKDTIYSNKYKLYVNNPILLVRDLNSIKRYNEDSCFSKTCFYNDSLYFNLELQNKGNVGIENVCLKLNHLKELNIDEESIKINGRPYNKIEDHILRLPSLNVSQKIYVEFYINNINIKNNESEIYLNLEYTFKDLITHIPYKRIKKIKENIVVINPDIEINKFIIDKDLELDKEFTKNINVKNTGNVLLTDIELKLNESDFLKNCKKVIFVNGNYFDSNDNLYISELDINETVNIAIRYSIESLEGYENSIPESNVIAKYTLGKERETLAINKKSNKLNMDIKNYSLDIKSKTNNDTLMLNTINKYVITLINDGNVNWDFINFKMILPKEISYVENSLCIDNQSITTKSLSLGVDVGELQCNQLKNISFDFKVNSLPYKNKLTIMSNAECEYKKDNQSIKRNFSNDDTILNVENIALDIVKVASSEVLQ